MATKNGGAARNPVRVRGTCAEGHVTETTAAPGRVTWKGQCAHDGCELQILARRIPRDRRPPETPESAETPPEPDEHAAREVSYGKRLPKHKRQQPVSPARESEPVEELQPVIDEQPQRPDEQPVELPHDGPADRRFIARAERRRGDERERPRRRFVSPLDW